MLTTEIKIRVRYGETDKMGVVYHANYVTYYEVGRTEMIRTLGLTYKELEEMGCMMPVVGLNVTYIKPAYYDNLLSVKTSIKTLPSARIVFYTEIFDEENDLINKGEATLVFLDSKTNRPRRPPEILMTKLNQIMNL